jgi:aspartate kinase
MIVAKFGGTSVADASAIARLIEIVRARVADRPVVVVSALAKVTDALLGLGRLPGTNDTYSVDAAVAALLDRHELATSRSRRRCQVP